MSILKNFIRTYDITETFNDKPCFLSITRFLQGQENTDLKGVYFDEDNFVVWAYNPKGWKNRAQALEWVLQQYMRIYTPIQQQPQQPRVLAQQKPQREYVHPQKAPMTQEVIIQQRKRTWNDSTGTQTQQQQKAIPKRKIKRTLEMEIEKKPDPNTETTQKEEKVEVNRPPREPANLEKMAYLKGVFSQLS